MADELGDVYDIPEQSDIKNDAKTQVCRVIC